MNSFGPEPSSKTFSAVVMPAAPAIGDQLAPSQRARPYAGTPPAWSNSPPTYSALPLPSSYDASARTSGGGGCEPGPRFSSPIPSVDQPPFDQRAMQPPRASAAARNVPTAYSAGPWPRSKLPNALTWPSGPLPG